MITPFLESRTPTSGRTHPSQADRPAHPCAPAALVPSTSRGHQPGGSPLGESGTDDRRFVGPRRRPLGPGAAIVATARYDPFRHQGHGYTEALSRSACRTCHEFQGMLHAIFGAGARHRLCERSAGPRRRTPGGRFRRQLAGPRHPEDEPSSCSHPTARRQFEPDAKPCPAPRYHRIR